MSDPYTRIADEILNRTQDPVQRTVLTCMKLDKTIDEIKNELLQYRVHSLDDFNLAWRNLSDQDPIFIEMYSARQREISSRMTFIPTPTIVSGDRLAPGPEAYVEPSTQTQQGPSVTGGTGGSIVQTHMDPNAGASTSQNISGANIDDSGFSNWRAAGFAPHENDDKPESN